MPDKYQSDSRSFSDSDETHSQSIAVHSGEAAYESEQIYANPLLIATSESKTSPSELSYREREGVNEMRREYLLGQLAAQIKQLVHTLAPHAHEKASSARFDGQLFHCNSIRLGDCLQEVRQSLAMLKQSSISGSSESVAWLAERMVRQIGALQREVATQSLRKKDLQTVPEEESLYEKLAKHQDYERRLRAAIADRESQLAYQDTLSGQQKLQREIAAQEGRLQRCLQALKRIEQAIEKSEQ